MHWPPKMNIQIQFHSNIILATRVFYPALNLHGHHSPPPPPPAESTSDSIQIPNWFPLVSRSSQRVCKLAHAPSVFPTSCFHRKYLYLCPLYKYTVLEVHWPWYWANLTRLSNSGLVAKPLFRGQILSPGASVLYFKWNFINRRLIRSIQYRRIKVFCDVWLKSILVIIKQNHLLCQIFDTIRMSCFITTSAYIMWGNFPKTAMNWRWTRSMKGFMSHKFVLTLPI